MGRNAIPPVAITRKLLAHRDAILRGELGFGFRMGKPHRVVELGTPKAEAYIVIKPRGFTVGSNETR